MRVRVCVCAGERAGAGAGAGAIAGADADAGARACSCARVRVRVRVGLLCFVFFRRTPFAGIGLTAIRSEATYFDPHPARQISPVVFLDGIALGI